MELVEIGSVRKTHGYNGELKLIVHEGYEGDLSETEFVFIGDEIAQALPYEVLGLRGNDFIVKLGGLTNKEDGASLRGKKVYLTQENVTQRQDPSQEGSTTQFHRFIGFAIIDEELGEVSMIDEVVEQPQNTLAKITHEGKEKLIPLNPQLIKGVDFTKKIVFMTLPEGLLDL